MMLHPHPQSKFLKTCSGFYFRAICCGQSQSRYYWLLVIKTRLGQLNTQFCQKCILFSFIRCANKNIQGSAEGKSNIIEGESRPLPNGNFPDSRVVEMERTKHLLACDARAGPFTEEMCMLGKFLALLSQHMEFWQFTGFLVQVQIQFHGFKLDLVTCTYCW